MAAPSTHNKYDWGAGVRVRVQRSCQAPYYSLFREENTRQTNSHYEGRRGTGAAVSSGFPSIVEDPLRLLFFPWRNVQSLRRTHAEADTVALERVTLIGATGPVGKFVAEQYLHRGISVTVLSRDIEKAQSVFLPIADGDQARRRSSSLGYVPLASSAQQPTLVASADYQDSQRSGKRVLRYEFAVTKREAAATISSSSSPLGDGILGKLRGLVEVPRSQHDKDVHECNCVTLEMVEGDVSSSADLEFAIRNASAVYYLASAIEEASGKEKPSECGSAVSSWQLNNWIGGRRCTGGFLSAFDACRRVDAHFIALTPLWVHSSYISPVYWYRRLFTYPFGYCRAVTRQEQTLLSQHGSPSPRCYFGVDELEEQQVGSDWSYWRRIWLSTELPEDFPMQTRSPVRFSLFRLSDIVFPSFNERMVAAKNNRLDDGLHVKEIQQGSLDARLLANVIAKSVSLCRSVVESRIDIGGQLKGGTDMRNAGEIFDLFEQFRNE